MNEWSLLIFTVCLQAAIGGSVMLAIFHNKISKLGEEKAFNIMKNSLIAIVVLSVVGLGASFTHLGSPGNAFYTIANLGSSWQSREILATGIFIGLAALTLIYALVKKRVNFGLLVATSVVGLIDVFFMGAIYANTLVSGWDSINTYASFFGTTFVLGPVLAVSFMLPKLREEADDLLVQGIIRSAFIISLLGFAIQMIGLAVFSATVPEVNMIAGTSALAVLDGYSATIGIRWVIGFVGIAVLGYLTFSKNKKLPVSVAYAALAVLFFAEGISRYVFYLLGA